MAWDGRFGEVSKNLWGSLSYDDFRGPVSWELGDYAALVSPVPLGDWDEGGGRTLQKKLHGGECGGGSCLQK